MNYKSQLQRMVPGWIHSPHYYELLVRSQRNSRILFFRSQIHFVGTTNMSLHPSNMISENRQIQRSDAIILPIRNFSRQVLCRIRGIGRSGRIGRFDNYASLLRTKLLLIAISFSSFFLFNPIRILNRKAVT